MKNEKELSEKYFGDREIPSRREMWDKIQNLSAKVEEVQDLRLADSTKQHNDLLSCYDVVNSLRMENKQLKQSQKQLAISELVKILDSFEFYEYEEGDTLVSSKIGELIFSYCGNRIKELEEKA